MSIKLVMPSNRLILCCPFSSCPHPSIRVFSSGSACRIRWPKYWSFSFSISPSDEYSGLISFRTDWFDLLACSPGDSQESLPQFKSISSSALSLISGPTSLSQPYMTTGNIIALTIRTFAGKLMSLLFNPGLSLWTKLVEVIAFQLSCFKSWKMMLWKGCTQYASKFGTLSSGHRTGKSQFSFQSQRKAMPENAQTTTQLHSSHMLVK